MENHEHADGQAHEQDGEAGSGSALIWPEAVRGLGLLLISLAAVAGLVAGGRRSAWLLAALTPGLGAVALLAAWAAAIHLTGGEKFDDHPCV